jgi:hypothetical protein
VPFQYGAEATGYVDALSVERNGDIRRARECVDFHPPQGSGIAAVIGLAEVHCTRRTIRILKVGTCGMDGGVRSRSSEPGRADSIDPGSHSERLLTMVCTGTGLEPVTHQCAASSPALPGRPARRRARSR